MELSFFSYKIGNKIKLRIKWDKFYKVFSAELILCKLLLFIIIISKTWPVTPSPSSKAVLRHKPAARGRSRAGVGPPLAFSFLALIAHSDPGPSSYPCFSIAWAGEGSSFPEHSAPQKCHTRCQETTFPVYFKTLSRFLFNVLKGYVLKRDMVK